MRIRRAIQTKYLGPTTFRSARIKAWTDKNVSVIMEWSYNLSPEDNHILAAFSLARNLRWIENNLEAFHVKFVGGCLPNGEYCFIYARDDK